MTEHVSKSPAIADITDTELAKKVQLFLSGNRRGLSRIDVYAEQGSVKLSGTVWSFFLRQLAVSVAKRVTGVHGVIDDLLVDTAIIETKTLRTNNDPRSPSD